MQKISIIIPLYNENQNVITTYNALIDLFQSKLDSKYLYEIVFIDDGSTDDSFEYAFKLTQSDTNVKLIQLSRNFGKEIALSAGINKCSGDACILLDCDMQHPIEKIPEFIKKWSEGYEIVNGLRNNKKKDSKLNQFFSKIYQFILSKISDTRITLNAVDFRLLDRKVIDSFNKFTERNRITRGLIDWLGYKSTTVSYEEKPRISGKTAFTFKKKVKLAMNSFVSHSYFPLKLAGYLGVIITAISLFAGVFIVVQNLVGDPLELGISGAAILGIMNLFLTGIMLSCLGLIALYIATIHAEVNDRPIYVVRQEIN